MKKIFTICILWLLAGSLSAAEIVVTSSADNGGGSLTTLREAITAANDGDVITFNLGPEDYKITLSSGLSITKSIAINGKNAFPSEMFVWIQVPASSSMTIFNISGSGKTVTLENMEIRGDEDFVGDVVAIASGNEVTLTNLSISGGYGTGRKSNSINNAGTLTVSNCKVSGSGNIGDNDVRASIMNSGTLSVVNSNFGGNTANYGAGLYMSGGTANLVNTTINFNQSNTGGAGIEISSGSVYLLNSIIVYNLENSAISDIRTNSNTCNAYYCWYGTASGTIGGSNNNTTAYSAGDFLTGSEYIGGFFETSFRVSQATATNSSKAGSGTFAYYNATDGYYFYNGSSYTKIADGTTFTPSDPVSDKIDKDFRYYYRITGTVWDGETPSSVTADITRGHLQYYGVCAREGGNWASGGDYYTTVKGAAEGEASGATINLAGTGIVAANIVLDDNETLTFQGEGRSITYLQPKYIEGENSARAIKIDDGSITFNDLTIRNAHDDYDYYGAGIYMNGTALTLEDCAVTYNYSTSSNYGGGIYANSGSVTITNTTFFFNKADLDGAGLYFDSSSELSVTGSTFQQNIAGDEGGGIYTNNGTITISGSTFQYNNCSDEGGGLYHYSDGLLSITGTNFLNNDAGLDGGGICADWGEVSITTSLFTDNSADADGGAISMEYNDLTITNSTFRDNNCGEWGGAIDYESYEDPYEFLITGCTFDGNYAGEWGGAMAIEYGESTLTNCTFSGNYTISSIKGGGALAIWSETSALQFLTIANNTAAGRSGGLFFDTDNSGTYYMSNCLIANNTGNGTGDDFYNNGATLVDNGYNLVEVSNVAATASGGFDNPTDILYNTKYGDATTSNTTWTRAGADMPVQNINVASSLADNGGTTETLAITAGSMAIGSGLAISGVTTDQRGTTRFNPPTIGAYDYPTASYTWTGSAKDNDWFTAGNWNNSSVPSAPDHVSIPDGAGSYPVIAPGEAVACNNLTIGSNATLTLQSTSEGAGALLTYGTVSGSATVQQYIDEDLWHFVGIPVSGLTAATYEDQYLQSYTEATDTWTDIVEMTTPLIPGQGYALWGIAKATTFTIEGTPNSGTINKAYTYTPGGNPSHYGFNLMGNPYPAPIDWELLRGDYGSVYYYDNGFKSWNNGGSGSRFIPPMQGFLIAPGATGTFTLNNTDKTPINNTQFYKSTEGQQYSILLVTTDKSHTDNLFIDFIDETSEGFDLAWDAWKIREPEAAYPQIYSFTDERILSIDRRPECDMIQLGFTCSKTDLFQIAATQINTGGPVILEDTRENIFHDLLKGTYEFAWDPVMDDEKRFKLHLNAVGIEESQTSESNLQIYAANGQIFVKNGNDLETDGRTSIQYVTVSDVMGRVVLQKEISGNGIISVPANLQTGVYLVTVQSGKEIKTVKVFIKK